VKVRVKARQSTRIRLVQASNASDDTRGARDHSASLIEFGKVVFHEEDERRGGTERLADRRPALVLMARRARRSKKVG
jgi:hypothetical protein